MNWHKYIVTLHEHSLLCYEEYQKTKNETYLQKALESALEIYQLKN